MLENKHLRRIARNLPLLAGALALSSCELIGPHVEENPIRMPENKSGAQAETRAPEPAGDLAATTSRMTEAELFAARAAHVAPTPKKKPVPEEEGKYSLNFDDADLGEVAKVILGESLKKNYVISPKVSGRVTLRTSHPLTDQELVPTLEMLLHMNGAVLIEDNGGYRIEPDSEGLARGRLGGVSGYRLQVIPLKYVGAQDMQTILEPIMPAKSVIKVDPVRNLLFLAGSGDDLERVIETVQVFDVNFLKGMSFGLYPLKNVAVNTIFGELQAMFGEGAGGPLAGVIRLLPVERLNAVMAITAQPGYLEDLKVWVDRLDRSNAAGGGNMHVYRVQHVDAIQLAATLSQIFGGGTGGFGGTGGLAPGLRPTTLSGGGMGGGFGGGGMTGQGSSQTGLSSGSSAGRSASTGMASGSTGSTSTTGSGFGSTGGMASAGGLGSSSGMGSGGGLSGFGMGGGSNASFGGAGMGGGMGAGSMGGQGGNAIRITADTANNALVIYAPPFDYESIEKLIKELDVMPLQVLVDAMIMEITLKDDLDYGVQWLFKHTHGEGKGALSGITDAVAGAASGGFGYSFIAKNVEASLQALATRSKVNVLSSPSLMVMNNQQAIIKVGDQVPIRTSETNNVSGQTTSGSTTTTPVTSTIQMRDTGVQLMLRPRVNKGGLVTMDIQQQVDDIKNTKKAGFSEIDSPTIAQRQIQSSIAVMDGDTIVLGGLITEHRTNTVTGMPILSTLPLIGPLFGGTTRNQDRTELIVLITPHVAEDRSQALSVTEEYKARLKGLADVAPASTWYR